MGRAGVDDNETVDSPSGSGTTNRGRALDDTLLGDALASGPAVAPDAGSPSPRPESRLPTRYEDLGVIARGSFGEVRRVHDTLLERVVAMKLMLPEHAGFPSLRQRFLAEARITAQLQHPGIVAVHDRGELGDGRLWFTMKEVRGRTLSAVVRAQHAASSPLGWAPTSDGWTFRRVVDGFSRIVQAIAFAHSRGVIHRDIKPANLMVGEFGEVLVMDWGLARDIAMAERSNSAPVGAIPAADADGTRHGDILGTPAFMAPEQARGDRTAVGAASDIYALGAVLYCILTGRAPYDGESAREVIRALLSGPPRPVGDVPDGPEAPVELRAIVTKAMSRDIEQRHVSADSLAGDLVSWLDGVRRREQALAAVAQARELEPEIASLRAKAVEAEQRAHAIQRNLRPFDDVTKKRVAWRAEDEASESTLLATLVETKWSQAVQGALSIDPDLPEAHAMLADFHRELLLEAERSQRAEDAARAEELLRLHDRGRHAALLRGEGRLTLATSPPRVEVRLEKLGFEDRRLVPLTNQVIGNTPIDAMPLARGSYVLRLRSPGHHEARYPVIIERDADWNTTPPGASEPLPVVLAPLGSLGPDDVYVPGGWTWIGGDPSTPDSLPRQRLWIDSFVIRRFPITNAEYLAFLNDLVARGRYEDAARMCPRGHEGSDSAGHPLYPRDERGQFTFPHAAGGEEKDWPVVLVDWYAAKSYADWLAARTGLPWRLPNELEREKAARGVDGRLLPWGSYDEPTFACVNDTAAVAASRERVQGHPLDESVYGVRGLAGNTRDWCLNIWKHEGPARIGERLCLDPAAPDDPDFRVIKGGTWTAMMVNGRAAARFGGRPDLRRQGVGIRVARSFR